MGNINELRNIDKKTVFLPIFLIDIFLYFNADALFSGFLSKDFLLVYMILPVVVYVLVYSIGKVDDKSLFKSGSFFHSLGNIGLGFLSTWAVVLFLFTLSGQLATPINRTVGLSFIFAELLVIAPVEEITFRRMIPDLLNNWGITGLSRILTASAIFAVFHLSVTHGDIGAMAMIFTIAVIWQYLADKERWGLGFTVGSHAAYNLVILGVLIPASLGV